jgi:5-methylcytosine-specific restriction enzyme B
MENFNRESILQAIQKIDENPLLIKGRESIQYDLIHNGKKYPPILVLSEANKILGGSEITIRDFNNSTRRAFKFLTDFGFEIMVKEIEVPTVWFVCQGSTFTEERGKKFLWAPKLDKNGKPKLYWENMKNVKKGDVIFNYSKGIRGVSLAKNDCYNAENPESNSVWGKDGFRVDIDLYEFKRVIDIDELKRKKADLDIALNNIANKPFNIDGGVNQGYLYEFSIEAGKIIRKLYGKPFINLEIENLFNDLVVDNFTSDTMNEKPQIDLLISNYFLSIKTKPFLILAGLSGTGKTRLVRQLAFQFCPPVVDLQEKANKPGNFELIKVRPNWHDSTELLGYVSQLQSKFISTPFVKFLIKAWKYKDIPFFVCLDEMNLAPVEQYFAEYLSVVETRNLINGEIVSDALIDSKLFTDYKTTDDFWKDLGIVEETEKEQFCKNGLTLPPNLIVIGTVNMDETTHSFSRKVLDRAMTIEMNDIRLNENLYNDEELGYLPESLPAELVIGKFTSGSQAAIYLKENGEENTIKEVITFLDNVNTHLEGSPFQIAYRVRDEFLIYMANMKVLSDKDSDDWLNSSLDVLLNMKVLPRIEGDEERTGKSLQGLEEIAVSKAFIKSSKKIEEMKNRLQKYHYTSYWP